MTRLESLTSAEIDGPAMAGRDESLALLAARVSAVLDARAALSAEWARHLRTHGPEPDPTVRDAVEHALGRPLS